MACEVARRQHPTVQVRLHYIKYAVSGQCTSHHSDLFLVPLQVHLRVHKLAQQVILIVVLVEMREEKHSYK